MLIIIYFFLAYSISIAQDTVLTQSDVFSFHPIDSSYEECTKNWVNELEWGQCIISHRSLWQNELDKYYELLLTSLDSTNIGLLKKSQASWDEYLKNYERIWITLLYDNESYSITERFTSAESFMLKIKERAINLRKLYYTFKKKKPGE